MSQTSNFVSCDSCDRKLSPFREPDLPPRCLYCRRLERSPLFKRKMSRANRDEFEAMVLYALFLCDTLKERNALPLWECRTVLKLDDDDAEYIARFARRLGADLTITGYRSGRPIVTLKAESTIRDRTTYWGIELNEQHLTNIRVIPR